jgi:hypothetical protein
LFSDDLGSAYGLLNLPVVLPTIHDQLGLLPVQYGTADRNSMHCKIILAARITHPNTAAAICILLAATPCPHDNVLIT